MWVTYARHTERREEIWAFLDSRNIGNQHALFYEEWANATFALGRQVHLKVVLTNRKKKTDEIYQLGIHRRAAPVERLKKRHHDFLQRILVASSRDIPDDEPLIPARSAGRSILGQVATAAAISGSVQLAPSTRLSRAPNGAKMGVFSDESGRGQDDAPGEWADFGTRDERRKENTVEATAWRGETLPQKGVAPRTPKVEVFRDMVRLASVTLLTIRETIATWSDRLKRHCSSQSSSPKPRFLGRIHCDITKPLSRPTLRLLFRLPPLANLPGLNLQITSPSHGSAPPMDK
jgi:checkpoint serine/threonine-protein kinase